MTEPKEIKKEYQRNWYLKHRTEFLLKQKEYRLKHLKHIAEINKNWREKNKDIIREKSKIYYIRDLDKIKIYRKKYQLTDKGIFRAIKDTARKDKKELTFTKKEFINWYNQQKKQCYYCGLKLNEVYKDKFGRTKRLTIDRKNNKIGYTIRNIVLACFRCNTIKSNYFTAKEMLRIGKIIKRIRKDK